MTAVFISHASEDGTQASAIKAWLNEKGFENVFLDLDRDGGLRAGENWERRLYEEVTRCHAVLLVVTPAWLASKWCFAEFSMARSLGKVIFPVLLRQQDIEAIGPELGSIQAEHWNEAGREHLAKQLDTVAFEIARGYRYSSDRPPYPGILSFDRDDAAVFFGRDPEIRRIAERLEARRVQGGARLLLVVGPSGSGKSSVVKAGVLPWLERDESRWIAVPPFRPESAPLTRLAKALAEAVGADNSWRELRTRLTEAPAEALTEVFETLLVGSAREATVLITVDQFEEAFAIQDGAEHTAFLNILNLIGAHALPAMVIATVRSDLMGEILKSQTFTAQHEVFTLGQLPLDRLPQVIEGPAHVAAVRLEEGLADRIIEDAVSADALPLLAFALREMYERFGRDGKLTILEYEALGDAPAGLSPLENAIRRKAEETITIAAPKPEEMVALKEAFIGGLVRVNEDGVRLRRPEVIDNLPPASQPLILQLIEARLLSARGKGEERVVEVSHEALFRAWPQLKTWLDQEQDFLIGRRHIEEAREIWLATPEKKQDSALLSGLLLERARAWTWNHPARLSEVRDFVTASIKREDREKARARRAQLTLTVVAVAAALVFGVMGVAAMLQWSRAEDALALAETEAARAQLSERAAAASRGEAEDRFALALGAVASGLTDGDPRLALFLAGEAVLRSADEAPSVAGRSAMIEARRQLATVGPHVLGSPLQVGDALSIALSPDGRVLAAGNRDGGLRLYDIDRGTAGGETIAAHAGGIESLAFDYSGRLLASAGSDGSVRLWRLDGGVVRGSELIEDFGDVAWSVGFDRTGSRLAASSENGVVLVWAVGETGIASQLAELKADSDILSVVFGPDGKTVLAGSGDGRIFGWRIDGGLPLFAALSGVHSSDIWEVLVSPNGDRFITVSSDGGSARLTYPDGAFLGFVLDPERRIRSVAFSRTGEVAIGGSEDGTLHLGRVDDPTQAWQSSKGHDDRIIEIAISADGQLLSSLGRDQSVRFWTLFEPAPLSTDRRLGEPAKGVAMHPATGSVAAGGASGAIQLWRGGAAVPEKLDGHRAQVWALDFSPDGKRLASADRDGEVRLWTPDDRTVETLAPADGAVWWIGFTPDGGRLVAAGDGGILIYDLTSTPPQMSRLSPDLRLTGGAISPDGSTVATASEAGEVTIADLDSGETRHRISLLEDIVWSIAFSPDGTRLAVARSDEAVTLLDTKSGVVLADLGGHSGGATGLGFVDDGATLAVTDRRGQLHFWDVATTRRLAPPLPAHAKATWRLDASGDDARFVTSGDDGVVRVWDIMDPARACELGRRALDAPHKREYFGEDAARLDCDAVRASN